MILSSSNYKKHHTFRPNSTFRSVYFWYNMLGRLYITSFCLDIYKFGNKIQFLGVEKVLKGIKSNQIISNYIPYIYIHHSLHIHTPLLTSTYTTPYIYTHPSLHLHTLLLTSTYTSPYTYIHLYIHLYINTGLSTKNVIL